MVASSAAAPAGAAGEYEQETKLNKLFTDLRTGFQKLEGLKDPNKQASLLKDLTSKMQEAKT